MEQDLIELMKCQNCKHFTGFYCLKENLLNNERSMTKAEDSCFNGLFEKEDKNELKEAYNKIISILRYYLVLKEEDYHVIALWILGTYNHDNFVTFPYLFFNAMRGSGKSRALKLISSLAVDGFYTMALTEAVIFRTKGTLAIDEFEGVGKKDTANLRELLNAAYKKGINIIRHRKKKSLDGEEQVMENFNVFRPICLANIWGMEEVLSDRCITLILEKSNEKRKTMLIENFDNPVIQDCKALCTKVLKGGTLVKCSLCSVDTLQNMYIEWNNYISNEIYTLHTHSPLATLTTLTTPNQIFFDKIYASNLDGRNLELFFPLFIVAQEIGIDVLENILNIAKSYVENKKQDELTENSDILFIDMIAKHDEYDKFLKVADLLNEFRNRSQLTEDWLNSRWIGRALKRLNLIKNKRRVADGMEVILNIEKAREKIKMFKPETK